MLWTKVGAPCYYYGAHVHVDSVHMIAGGGGEGGRERVLWTKVGAPSYYDTLATHVGGVLADLRFMYTIMQ